RAVLADQSEWKYSYSAAGDLETLMAPNGSVVMLSYDDASRLTGLTSIPGPERVAVPAHVYAYDGLDRLVSAAAAGASVTRAYDGLGRLRLERVGSRTFERTYGDLLGTATLLYPDGRQEAHAWDLLGRINRVTLLAPGSSAVGPLSGTAGDVLLA